MAAIRHLSNAPIAEAIIEFHVDPSPEGTEILSDPEFHPFGEDYPTRAKQVTSSFQIGLTATGADTSSIGKAEHVGYRFASTDGKRIVDFGRATFAFHRLRPYTQWSELRDEARSLWARYVALLSPIAITRVGVRYVNGLAIPINAKDLSDYLVRGPIVPDGLPQAVQAFFSRVEIADDANQRTGIITQAFQGLTPERDLSVIMDIDAIRIGAIEPPNAGLWSIVDKLRDFKNEMFFRSVTDLLLERYA